MSNCDQSTQRIEPKTSVFGATPVWKSRLTDCGVSASVLVSAVPNSDVELGGVEVVLDLGEVGERNAQRHLRPRIGGPEQIAVTPVLVGVDRVVEDERDRRLGIEPFGAQPAVELDVVGRVVGDHPGDLVGLHVRGAATVGERRWDQRRGEGVVAVAGIRRVRLIEDQRVGPPVVDLALERGAEVPAIFEQIAGVAGQRDRDRREDAGRNGRAVTALVGIGVGDPELGVHAVLEQDAGSGRHRLFERRGAGEARCGEGDKRSAREYPGNWTGHRTSPRMNQPTDALCAVKLRRPRTETASAAPWRLSAGKCVGSATSRAARGETRAPPGVISAPAPPASAVPRCW